MYIFGYAPGRRIFKFFTWIRTWAFQETPEKACPCPSSAEPRQCRCSTPKCMEGLYNILNSDAGSGSAIWMRIRIQILKLMRIRIRSLSGGLFLRGKHEVISNENIHQHYWSLLVVPAYISKTVWIVTTCKLFHPSPPQKKLEFLYRYMTPRNPPKPNRPRCIQMIPCLRGRAPGAVAVAPL
jgi:hypothetical protein